MTPPAGVSLGRMGQLGARLSGIVPAQETAVSQWLPPLGRMGHFFLSEC